ERTGKRPRLPPRHVRGGRPRRYAGPAPRARRAARRRSGPVQGRVSALLRPRPRGHSHRAGRASWLTPKRARASFANTGPAESSWGSCIESEHNLVRFLVAPMSELVPTARRDHDLRPREGEVVPSRPARPLNATGW